MSLMSQGAQLTCESPSIQGASARRASDNPVPVGRGEADASAPEVLESLFPKQCPEQACPVLCFLTIICLNNSSIVLCQKRYSPGHTVLHPLGKTKSDVLPLP